MINVLSSKIVQHKINEFFSVITLFIIFGFLNIIMRPIGSDFPVGRSIAAAILLGISVSIFEIVLSGNLKKRLSQGEYFFIASAYYFISTSLILLLMGYITLIFKNNLTILEAFRTNIFEYYNRNYSSFPEILFTLFIFIAAVTLLRENFRLIGIGLVADAYRGRYKNPNVEERIFFFMDLKSSTTYAEQLGARKYSAFIKDIFREMDDAILETNGQLYQYVGDQVVVVWKKEKGITDNNCIRLNILITKRMEELRTYFHQEYGLFPEFKTAVHIGHVAITEVGGILKKEIAYHGDAINTTSRICSKCSEVNESFLVSEDILNELCRKTNLINYESIGDFNLRGKKNSLSLFKILSST